MEQMCFTWPPPKQTAPIEEKIRVPFQEDSSTDDTPRAAKEQPSKQIKPHTKTAAVLKHFIKCGERGLNCFEAVRLCHDYVLRTSVSNLQLQYGLLFQRRFEQVPGHGDSTVECCRYWLGEAERKKAAELLGLTGSDHVGA